LLSWLFDSLLCVSGGYYPVALPQRVEIDTMKQKFQYSTKLWLFDDLIIFTYYSINCHIYLQHYSKNFQCTSC